jgi:hypothetical protein
VALYSKQDSINKSKQQVLDFADTIDVRELFEKSEEVGDILKKEIITEESIDNEESIEKEIKQNKKKSKYSFNLIIRITFLMLQRKKSFTGSLKRFYSSSKHCLTADIKIEAEESMKQGNENEI